MGINGKEEGWQCERGGDKRGRLIQEKNIKIKHIHLWKCQVYLKERKGGREKYKE